MPTSRLTHTRVAAKPAMQDTLGLPPMQLGYARTPLRRMLVDAVLRGEKTATSSLRAEYEPHADEPMPRAGERLALLDYDDRPVAIVETTEVRVLRIVDVDLAFARDEGEGFETVTEWRLAHERFWSGQEIGDQTLIVAERFRLIERL
jgi:uncharacterized protein YhfF